MTGRERAALIIRQAIKKSGLQSKEVARRAGMDPSVISGLKHGHHDPKLSTVLRVIEACGLEFIEIRIRKIGIDINATKKSDSKPSQA